MTTPTRFHLSPRALAAWALVGYAALHLMFSFFDWVLDDGGSFLGRSAGAGFTNLFVMAMPLVAVLVAASLTPALGEAKLISTIALIEYAISLVFGLFTLLIGFGSFAEGPARNVNYMFDMMRYLVLGVAGLALIAVAAWVVLRTFTKLGGTLPITISRPPAA